MYQTTLRNPAAPVLLFAVLIVLGGCEGVFTTEARDAHFFAQVEGEDFDRAFNGPARIGEFTEPELDEQGVMLQLSSENPEQGAGITIVGRKDELPVPGSYDIVAFEEDDDEMAFEKLERDEFYAVFEIGTLDRDRFSEFFESMKGELEVEERDGESIIGTFEFEAAGHEQENGSNELQVTISGEFEALESDIELQDNL